MLDEFPSAKAWLSQFSAVDEQVGRQLLRSLRLISTSDLERHLDETLDALLGELGNEVVALYSVPELACQRRRVHVPDREHRRAGSSADRVRHYLENFARARSRRARSHPTVDALRSERTHHIVLVEDFIGSGRRISSFLREGLPRSVKSWISYGWVKLWIVAYGGLNDGVYAIQRCGHKLSHESFRFVVPPTYGPTHFTVPMLEFCKRNSWRTNRSTIPLGFANGGTNLIFEHGCPNNAPVLLWATGRSAGTPKVKYQPLFPNRGIPSDLRSAFGAPTPERAPEILWQEGQYRLALALLRERRIGRQSGHWLLTVALGLSSRTRWDNASIADAIAQPIIHVERLRAIAVSLGALDDASSKLTAFGRTLLDLIRTGSVDSVKQPRSRGSSLATLYYPRSCEGQTQY